MNHNTFFITHNLNYSRLQVTRNRTERLSPVRVQNSAWITVIGFWSLSCLMSARAVVNMFNLPHMAAAAVCHIGLFDSPGRNVPHSNVWLSEWGFWNCSLSLTSATVDSRTLNHSPGTLYFCPVCSSIRTYSYYKTHNHPLIHLYRYVLRVSVLCNL